MKKICIVLTTRGNYAKFKKLISMVEMDSALEAQLVVGGELLLSDRVTSLFNIKATHKVYFNLGGDNLLAMGKSVGLAVSEFCGAFNSLEPDLVLLVGDRFETFAAASAAYLSGVPIAHLEGGEISGTLDNRLRYAISELASVHFPCTEAAGNHLWDRGYSDVFVVGSTSIDALLELPERIKDDLMDLQANFGTGSIIDSGKSFLLAILHPDTSNEGDISNEAHALIGAIDHLKVPTFWLNANLDAGGDKIGAFLRQYRDSVKPDFIHFFKSLPIEYFGHLLKNAACIVGNSSLGIREASYFGVPNVSIGMRQHGREKSWNTTFVKANKDFIIQKIVSEMQHGPYNKDTLYGNGKASQAIWEIIRI